MARSQEGYTLVELVVVIMIFSIVMALISVSFNRIVSSSAQIVKSAETDIGGLIGLEMFRCDLDLAGFGLPWSLPGVKYREVDTSVNLVKGCPDGCPQARASLFNDASINASDAGDPPRAYVTGNNVGFNGSDYLVLKGTALGMSATSRSWSYLNYSSTGAVIKPSKSEVELKPGNSDRVIVVKSGSSAGVATRELVTDGGVFSLLFNPNPRLPSAFEPTSKQDSYLVYGVAPADDSGLALSFPFNRADYFISRKDGDISSNCAPGTGVLIKATINQNGSVTKYPILDCVADLQVVFSVDSNGDGEVDDHLDDLAGWPASQLRDQVKEIKVYILAQQGKKDRDYLYPVGDPSAALVVGDAGLNRSSGAVHGSLWSQAALSNSMGPDWRNYHWKFYTIVLQPKNL